MKVIMSAVIILGISGMAHAAQAWKQEKMASRAACVKAEFSRLCRKNNGVSCERKLMYACKVPDIGHERLLVERTIMEYRLAMRGEP